MKPLSKSVLLPTHMSLVLAMVLALSACMGFGRQPADTMEDDLTEIGAAMVERPLLRSVSIGVLHRGKAYTYHAGTLRDGGTTPPSDDTLYEIGSVSKTFTGTLLAKAVVEGRISLDDPVADYLDGPMPNLVHDGEPLRIRHLLTHTGGLPNLLPERAEAALVDFTDHATPAKLTAAYAGYDKAAFLSDLRDVSLFSAPGRQYSYSSVGTELGAHVLEQVYDADFERILKSYFTDNVGMDGIRIGLDAAHAERLAIGYHSDNPEPASAMPQLPWGASGNVKLTTNEMLQYLAFQLAGGDVVEESHRALHDADDGYAIGYFWEIFTGNPETGVYYSHHGGVPRAQCYTYVFPDLDLAIFIITNQSGNDTAEALQWGVDQILAGMLSRSANSAN